MKRSLHLLGALFLSGALASAWAIEPVPITADEAFDLVTYNNPAAGDPVVALVDVRSRAEYYWVGTAARVDSIRLKGRPASITPDRFKVRLIHGGKFLEYAVNGRYQRVLVEKVESLKLSPIALSIPFQLWDEAQGKLIENKDFGAAIEQLADPPEPEPGESQKPPVDVLILFCRSGGRSTNCAVKLDLAVAMMFDAIYEIDDPDGALFYGGFEGSGYGQAYNGYLGFPGRETDQQPVPSVSWKDAGLPIVIGTRLPALPPPEED